jgi:hypothetical protein
VDALAEAAGVLARAWGQPDGRTGKPPRPGEAARRAHELLRLAKPGERDRLAGGSHMAPCRAWEAAMISHADVEKLRSIRAPEPAVLSLYLPVDPVGVRGLAARAEDLMAGAGAGGPDGAGMARAGHA